MRRYGCDPFHPELTAVQVTHAAGTRTFAGLRPAKKLANNVPTRLPRPHIKK
jgi:hypothetical protein